MKILASILFTAALCTSFTSRAMELTELPVGSTVKVYSVKTIPAGWDKVYWGSVGMIFKDRLPNMLDLSNTEFKTSELVYSAAKQDTHAPARPGTVGVTFGNDEYNFVIQLKNPIVYALVIDEFEYDCNKKKVKKITVEMINECMKGHIEIIPNMKPIRP